MDLTKLEVGDVVELGGDHPHAGKLGVVESIDPIAMLGNRPYPRILLQGGSCYVTRANEATLIRRRADRGGQP